MIDVMRCDAMRLGFVPTGWFQMFLYLFFLLDFWAIFGIDCTSTTRPIWGVLMNS